jgi:hypothetical protein
MDEFVAPTEDFAGGDLVVDLPYRNLVAEILGGLDPRVTVVETRIDETLGLALLSLDGLEAYAAAHPDPALPEPLDVVLSTVRGFFAAHCAGWTPDMGKNRDMRGVIGFPQSKPLAGGVLKQASADEYTLRPNRTAGRGVRIGVLDTDLYPHPTLAGHYRASSTDLYQPPAPPVPPWAGHATFVAGLIVLQAPAATLDVSGVLDNETGRASAWDTAVAMVGFADRNVDILNVSLGCRTRDGQPPLVMRRAVEVLGNRMVIVAAAGNHGVTPDCKDAVFPAALPGVLAVGAAQEAVLDDEPTLALITPKVPWVDCLAPGFAVVSTYLNSTVRLVHEGGTTTDEVFTGFAKWSGTSFAAGTVSGAIARGTVPGRVTAAQALAGLLDTPNPVVRRYAWRHDGDHAGRPCGGEPGTPGA